MLAEVEGAYATNEDGLDESCDTVAGRPACHTWYVLSKAMYGMQVVVRLAVGVGPRPRSVFLAPLSRL
eukprot:7973731-Pyramimonas_sp.AAC.1